jgi:hypothetical protein
MDALSETLRVVRLVGAIFINAKFTAPWCYQSPRADTAAPILEPGAERVVIFHLITEGECWVELGDEPPMRLIAGDAVIFPQGDAHRMGSAPGLTPAPGTPLKELLPQLDPQAFWQIHRGTVVQAAAIDSVHRDEAGKLSLSLRGRPEKLAVSRLYSQQFRAM